MVEFLTKWYPSPLADDPTAPVKRRRDPERRTAGLPLPLDSGADG